MPKTWTDEDYATLTDENIKDYVEHLEQLHGKILALYNDLKISSDLKVSSETSKHHSLSDNDSPKLKININDVEKTHTIWPHVIIYRDLLCNIAYFYLYYSNYDRKADYAIHYLKRAESVLDPYAITKLGDLYSTGYGSLIKDQKKAFEKYQLAMLNGNTGPKAYSRETFLQDGPQHYGRAAYQIGNCYDLGLGVRQDIQIAAQYYKDSYNYYNLSIQKGFKQADRIMEALNLWFQRYEAAKKNHLQVPVQQYGCKMPLINTFVTPKIEKSEKGKKSSKDKQLPPILQQSQQSGKVQEIPSQKLQPVVANNKITFTRPKLSEYYQSDLVSIVETPGDCDTSRKENSKATVFPNINKNKNNT